MRYKKVGNDGLTRIVKAKCGRKRTLVTEDVSQEDCRDRRYTTAKKREIWLNWWIACNDMVEAAKRAELWGDVKDVTKPTIVRRCKRILQEYPELLERKYEMLEERLNESIAAADEVLRTASEIMRNEAKEEMVMVVGKGKGVQEIERVKKDMTGLTRMKAVEFLGKHYGLADNKLKVDGALPVVIQDDM